MNGVLFENARYEINDDNPLCVTCLFAKVFPLVLAIHCRAKYSEIYLFALTYDMLAYEYLVRAFFYVLENVPPSRPKRCPGIRSRIISITKIKVVDTITLERHNTDSKILHDAQSGTSNGRRRHQRRERRWEKGERAGRRAGRTEDRPIPAEVTVLT